MAKLVKKKQPKMPGSTGKPVITSGGKLPVKSDARPGSSARRAQVGAKPGVVLPGPTGKAANAPKKGSQAKRVPGPVKRLDGANGIFGTADTGNAAFTPGPKKSKRTPQNFESGPRRGGGSSAVRYRRASR